MAVMHCTEQRKQEVVEVSDVRMVGVGVLGGSTGGRKCSALACPLCSYITLTLVAPLSLTTS